MVLALLALAASTFAAGTPAFDPRRHKTEIAGPPAQILVLGTMHLSQLPHPLDTRLLDPLLARLARFRPDVITIEGVAGEECDTLRRFMPQHGDASRLYCFDPSAAEKATGLDVPSAEAEIDRTLAAWPNVPTPAQRRRLAMLFIAAGDLASAQVQWRRLPPEEQHSGDGLTDPLVEVLVRKGRPVNENYAIGAALAAWLGLERVYPADDHLSDGPNSGPDFDKALKAAWNNGGPAPVHAEFKRREASLGTADDVLSYYRFLNDPKTERASIAGDMGRAARDPSPQQYGRQYLSWWESRNLRMAANIRAAFYAKPGARVLVIVGSSHKGYLDAYLDMMQGVQLVDAMQFLR